MGRSQRTFNMLMRLWPLGKVVNRLGYRPLVGSLLSPWFSPADSEVIIIPVQEAIHGAESMVLPHPLLNPLVEQASARFIMNDCVCRRGEGCQTYPQDIGCLFLGDGATEINPTMGRLVSVDEALDHVQWAMETGLTPLIAHASIDAWVLGIPYRRMLAVCFCCDCCCVIRQGLRLGPPAFWDTVLRLPGLAVDVGTACVGCGTCAKVCPVQAISLDDGRVCIDERCKGCGRCAAVCPAGAIALRVDENVDVLGHVLARIGQRTDIGPEMDVLISACSRV